ncbi:MAG: penicillin-insensitive murein endopeptidase [Elusimicrobia bacterium]|nr:penicillin-insensitive murein endopeptidase [Elusimicrobiota bacterium]
MPRKFILAAAVAVPVAALAAVPLQQAPAGAALARSQASWSPLRGLLSRWPRPSPFARRTVELESLSWGLPGRGRLINGAELPAQGPHWRSIRTEVGRVYGTSELVDGLRWVAERLRVADAETPALALGDLSAEGGGRAPRHRSHQNGRDADLNFFWTDPAGRPVFSERMTSFDAKGRGSYAGRPVRFDARRNWSLVAGLLTNPHFGRRVRWVFVSRGLRALLLKEAAAAGAAPDLVERAGKALAQPPGSSHRNHFHLRIACSAEDLRLGCRD